MTTERDWDMPVVHVYGQDQWHDEVVIAGNKAGLEDLRRALNGERPSPWLFVKDGEGYHIAVVEVEDPNELPAPYADDMASEKDSALCQRFYERRVLPVLKVLKAELDAEIAARKTATEAEVQS